MKKFLKRIIIIFVILISALCIAYGIFNNIKNKVSVIANANEEYNFENSMGVYEVTTSVSETYVRSSGTITSFNIQTLDVEEYEKVKNIYVKDGQYVKAKNKVMKISGDGTRYIKAPISGMFFKIKKGEGEFEYKIYNLEDIGVSIEVSEKDVSSLKIGQKAIVKLFALNQELEGKVSYISMLPYEGKFNVNIKIPYSDEIKFGYTANIKILTSKNEESIVIPYEALNMEDDGRYYVIEESFKENALNFNLEEDMKKYVQVGNITEDYVEIVNGLEVGMKILYWKW